MLDRLRVADLRDEIVGMQMEINSLLYVTHNEMAVKNEQLLQQISPQLVANPISSPINQSQSTIQQPLLEQLTSKPTTPTKVQFPVMQQPNQILKAMQEQKINHIINVKPEVKLNQLKIIDSTKSESLANRSNSPIQKPSMFDILKNEPPTNLKMNHMNRQQSQPPPLSPRSPTVTKQHPKIAKKEIEDFDIESEILPSVIMKNCENMPTTTSNTIPSGPSVKKVTKLKERESEFANEYYNTKCVDSSSKKEKSETTKIEPYDEWLCIQKELNMQLAGSSTNYSSNKENKKKAKSLKNQLKNVENELSDIFEANPSPKSVEKQLDDLFNSSSKTNDLMPTPSPLAEMFPVEAQTTTDKVTVENRLEALFGESEDESPKNHEEDLVETRLEQLFQGTVAENDESALDNASFLYKSSDITYDLIQQQIHVSTAVEGSSSSNKRPWNSGSCDMLPSPNAALMYSTNAAKRACTSGSVSGYNENKWMVEDAFDFACDSTEMMASESTGEDITKQNSWNGDIMGGPEDMELEIDNTNKKMCYPTRKQDVHNQESMISGIQSPQEHLQHHHIHLNMNQQQIHHNSIIEHGQHMFDPSQLIQHQDMPINFEDDINRQVQNAIDSILNLQNSDADASLHFPLDPSFLELTTAATTSNASTMQHNHNHQSYQIQETSLQMQHLQTHHKSMAKRKYSSRLDGGGDCLIGGSNLDDSPSSLALTEGQTHATDVPNVVTGEFVNNLLDEPVKSVS